MPIIALALPVLELLGIFRIWQAIGAWTLAWLLLAVLAGVALIKREWSDLAPRLMHGLLHGDAPLQALLGIGLRFLAGVLLILPGALSDAVALILLLFTLGGPRPRMPPPPGPARPADADVIEGEYRRME